MTEPSAAARRERARLLYVESDLAVREVADRVGVDTSTITRWAQRLDWPRRRTSQPGTSPQPPDISREDAAPRRPRARPATRRRKTGRPSLKSLVERLYRLIIHNLEVMEIRMSEDDSPTGERPERDMRAIGNIVRNIEKLREIEPDQSKRDASTGRGGRFPLTPEQEEELQRRLVERILRVAGCRERNPGDSDPQQ